MFKCSYCRKTFSDLSALFAHVKKGCPNATDAGGYGGYRCGMCSRSFFDIYTWRRHIQSKHVPSAQASPCKSLTSSPAKFLSIDYLEKTEKGSNTEPVECTSSSVFEKSETESPTGPTPEFNVSDFLTNQLAAIISSFHSDASVTSKRVQTFVDAFRGFHEDIIDVALERLGDDSEGELGQMCEHVNEFSEKIRFCLRNVWKSLGTVHLREKFFVSKGTLVLPQDVYLGVRDEVVGRNLPPRPLPVVGQFVPMREILRNVLSIPGLMKKMDEYLIELAASPGLSHFMQSSVWLDCIKRLPAEGGKIYPLYLFFDDFETGNPLGSHAGIHKLGGMYMSLPSLPPTLASQLRYIFLVFLFHSSDRDTFGNRIFQIVIDEINFLSTEGVQIDIEGVSVNVRFVLGCILGDNLGLNTILGFSQSFSAAYCCRFCRAKREDFGSLHVENSTLLRNPQNYAQDLKLNDVAITAVKEKCVWLGIHTFDLFSHVALDYMHDFLEGVCVYTMKTVVEGLITNKVFDLQYLNDRINEFDYGHDSGNKPPLLKATSSKTVQIKMSSSECLRFVSYFGLMVGHRIERSESNSTLRCSHKTKSYAYYELYLLLRKIMDIVVSENVYPELTIVLTEYISDFIQLYVTFQQGPLKPKFHLLTHYPSMMLKRGPIGPLSSMRFEAKHRAGKSAVRSAAGWLNICKTAAKKLQLQSNHLFFTQPLGTRTLTTSKFKQISPEELLSLRHHLGIEESLKMHKVSFLCSTENVTFRPRDVVCVSILDHDFNTPQFVQLTDLYVDENLTMACAKSTVFETIAFSYHFHAYIVQRTGQDNIIDFKNLAHSIPHTLTPSPVDDDLYVTVRNAN